MERTPIPSPSQLALAMAIVKLKPVGLDIKEHLLQIRRHIGTTHRTDRFYTHDKYLDSVSFWQQAYEQSEAEQSKLLERIFELEQRNESLLARLQGTGVTGEEGTLKRKVTGKSVASGNDAPIRKRAKTQIFPQTDSLMLANNVSDGLGGGAIDHLQFPEQFTAPFMRQFYTLQKVLQKRPNNSSIIRAAIELCSTAVGNVRSAIKQPTESRASTKNLTQPKRPNILAILNSTECAFRLLVQALRKLSTTGRAMQDVGHVTYHIVRLYEVIIEVLDRHCKSKSEKSLQDTKTGAQTSRQRQKAKPKRTKTGCSSDVQKDPDYELANQMSLLLSKMALSLDTNRLSEQNVLEGFLLILLDRIGTLLCLFVFQDLRLRPDLQIDEAKFPLPEGLKEIDLNENSINAAAMEAKFLIWPLERILTVLDDVPGHDPLSTQFTTKVKERLQSTLLHSVFGTDSLWPDVLQRPVQPDDADLEKLRSCLQIPEQSVPDWFVQEVWRLLGWEMLATSNSSKI
ncbi:hypothetical protein BO94DRAFT_328510 [Aspergillus sclerotioniger CBS 115572]|uniref:Uncharacterized protein n=1 Tax=Aspergillus sclerotioniger CBS 115572 TaxID=1450535 RepID=A0A317X6X4_9EURO|nr:hypothetical protein BO94DRAFT_328510 [Aspergillus sclerotioniger CBS 115572]PWY94323.1 hypothetical protein BO94DRAFT_328510 [Aspergillus sclerotioniger CBS 115572]